MSTPNFLQIKPNGINLPSNSSTVVASPGDLAYNSSSNKFAVWATASDFIVQEATAATLTNKIISGSSNTLSNIAYSSLILSNNIVNSDINTTAAIAYSKLAALSPNQALISNSSGFVTTSTVTATELGYVSGVTSAIQTQLNSKLNLSGGTMSGAINMGTNQINNMSDPTSAQDAATKAYVDAGLAALNPADAVYAATTGSNILGTYLNGVGGIGATFTTTATGTFTIDGATPSLGARILIKDQSSGFQNGVYNITTLGTIGVSTVFTRALDYDTPSDINSAGLIPVINGTVNSLSSWQQVASITTVGTDNLIFQEFTANPSLYLLKSNNLSDVASKTTSFNNISPMTTSGDMIYENSTPSGTRLPIGSTNQVLAVSGGIPTWSNLSQLPIPQGNKNYLSGVTTSNGANNGNGNWELGSTTGWSLAHSALSGVLPASVASSGAFSSSNGGSPASGNLSLSVVSSGQISGSYSGSLASSAASTAGDMLISNGFNIDTEDQAKMMQIKLYYNVNSGASNLNFSGTSSNSFAVWIYDVTNAVWIMPAGVYNLVQNSGSGYVTATFQTTSNSTQYQLALININASGGAYTLYLDDLFVGPQIAPSGPNLGDWIQDNSTVSPINFGVVSNLKVFRRRIGDTLHVSGTFTSGTVQTATAYLALNNIYTIDTTKISTASSGTRVGLATQFSNGAATTTFGAVGGNSLFFDGAITNQIFYTYQTTSGAYTKVNADSIEASNETSDFYFSVPVQGWSSNSIQSSDTDTRVVIASAYALSSTSLSSNTPTVFTTIVSDTHSAYNTSTGRYTIPVSGYYEVGVVLPALSASTGTIYVSKNSATYSANGQDRLVDVDNTIGHSGSVILKCNAGDTLAVQSTSSITFVNTQGNLSINRFSGPVVVAATESINAHYHGSTSTINGSSSLVQIIYNTKDFDTHNAYNTSTGNYTCPISGKYEVSACVYPTGGPSGTNSAFINIYKNGAPYSGNIQANVTGATDSTVSMTDIVACNAGDTLSIYAATNSGRTTINASDIYNYVTIERVGN